MKTNEIIYQHVYQNTVEGVLLFYDNSDRIVFFTILSVLSERYGIRIIAVSLMPDHYHLLVEANGRKQLENFIRTLNSVYAKAFNLTVHRKGKLFNRKYGCASKKTTKDLQPENIEKSNYFKDCNLTDLYNGKCKIKNPETKNNIILNIKNQLINGEIDLFLLNVTNEEKKDLILKDNDSTYQITSTDNQNINEYDDISTIILGECENKLREYYI